MCKAIEDLIKDSEAKGETNTIFKLRREGYLTVEVAADELGLSVDEYTKREDEYFSSLDKKKDASISS